MQRVSAFLPSWDKRHSGNPKHSSLFGWSNRLSTSQPPNGLATINTAAANSDSQRVHKEVFWPATLDLECDKAARILKSFCVDGYLAPDDNDTPPSPSSMEPQTPVKIPKKIPKRIIQNAAGIAVFTCMRSGLWMTGSGGSGILIARKSDGTWSPPSGIMLHTPTLSFIIGVDIYDCVLVISNLAALESVTKPRLTLGDDVELRTGQTVPLDSDEAEVNWRDLGNTVLTYMKARGQHQSVNLSGCILAERCNENERFYYPDVTQIDILAGNVARHVEETTPLFEVIKMAEGRTDFEHSIIEQVAAQPAPGDAIITTPMSPTSPQSTFGIPKVDDPDPYGVLALEMAGLEIREAGSKIRPTSSLFDLNQNPMSPVFSKFGRQSMETFVSRSNRGSYMSLRTIKSQVTDAGTQTDVGNTPETTPSPGPSPAQIPNVKEEDEEIDYTAVDITPIRHISQDFSSDTAVVMSTATMTEQEEEIIDVSAEGDGEEQMPNKDEKEEEDGDDTNDADDEDDVEEDEEEPVVFEVAAVQPARTQAVASRVIQARGNVVTIAKRIPPPLPTRSPARMSRINKTDAGISADIAGLQSPLRQAFSESDLAKEEDKVAQTELTEQDNISETLKVESVENVEASTKEAEAGQSDGETIHHAEELKLELKYNEPRTEDADVGAHKSDAMLLNEPHQEHAENSDSASNKKHTSSIYTGATEDRWSFDGSSVTTPTSERRFSIAEDTTTEDTPKKSMKEMEKPEAREASSPLSEVTPSPIAATH